MHLQLGHGRHLDLQNPVVMGVINTSPDSFFAPCLSQDQALRQAEQMIHEGAQILDIGAEATNPQTALLPASQLQERQALEIERIVPLVAAISARFDVVISVDTSRPEVMHAAFQAGAHLINDQRGLSATGAAKIVADCGLGVCLMHNFEPVRQPGSCSPQELLQQIYRSFAARLQICAQQGIANAQILIDPGFGQGHYGKNVAENFYLLSQLQILNELGIPILVGWSRKSMLGAVLGGAPAEQRLFGSIAAHTIAVLQGAKVIRTHDVRATCDAVRVVQAFDAVKEL